MALNAHFNSALNNLALDMYANAYHAKIESGAEPPKSREEFLQLFKTMFDVKVKSENMDDGDVVIIDPPSKAVETVSVEPSVEPAEVKVVAKAPRAPRKKSEKSASTSSDDETSSVESSESGVSVVSKQRIKAEKAAEKLRIKAEKDAEKAKAKALKDAEKAKAKALKEVEQAKAKAEKEAEKEAKALKKAEKEEKPLVETKSATTNVEETHEELSDGEVDEDENYVHKFTLDQKNYGVDCDNDVFEIKSNGDSTFVGTWDPESRFATFNELE